MNRHELIAAYTLGELDGACGVHLRFGDLDAWYRGGHPEVAVAIERAEIARAGSVKPSHSRG